MLYRVDAVVYLFPRFEARRFKQRPSLAGEFHHSKAVFERRHLRLLFMRRTGGGNKKNAIKMMRAHGFARDAQMSVMNRVKCAAK
jgi:hypothetical protein